MKPKIFIGSTAEGKEHAQALVKLLREFSSPTPWYDGVFEISGTTQKSLIESIRASDFVVIILTADDQTQSRGDEFFSPRDNLIFEAGIGFGAIGSERTFLVPEHVDKLKLPTDLNGFTLTKSFKRSTKPKEDLAPIVDQIEDRVKEQGKKSSLITKVDKAELSASAISLIESADRHVMLFGRDLSWANIYSCAIEQRISQGVEVEVFSETPNNKYAKDNAKLLTELGVSMYFLDKDHGMKFTMIDHHDAAVARFMVASKERNPMGSTEDFSYNCEIHDARESRALWNSLKRLYESVKGSL